MKKILIFGLIFILLFGIGFYLFKPDKTEIKEDIKYPQEFKTQYGLLEKTYDSAEQEVILTNQDTKEESIIKLNTPINYRFWISGASYEKVAEMNFKTYYDFKEYLSQSNFELINLNDGKSIDRKLDFKFKTFEDVTIDKCEISNITAKEECVAYLETKESWKDIGEYVFKPEESVTIGIFTTIYPNDYVEWIPTIYGVEISEWANWQVDTAVNVANLSIAGQHGTMIGIFMNSSGTGMWLTGGNNIYQYYLSTAWDVSTAVNTINKTAPDAMYGVYLNSSGTGMYTVSPTKDNVYQWYLSTPFDISTAVNTANFSTAGLDSAMGGVWFSDDGDTMYLNGWGNDNIYKNTLSTPWLVTTTTNTANLSTLNFNDPTSIFVNSTETGIYLTSDNADKVFQLNLGTGGDLSTATNTANLSVIGQDDNMKGIFLNSTGGGMYTVGYANDRVYQYFLGSDTVPSIPQINVSLVSPKNDSSFVSSTQTFTAQLTNDTYPLVNATLYVWYANGTSFNVTSNTTLSSVNTNNVTFNVAFSDMNRYYWNVKGVQGNANGTNTSFAATNNTFLWGIAFGNQEYNTQVIEQSSQTFKINFSLTSFGVSTVILVYNGTNYSGSFASVNSTTTQATTSLIVPTISADTNVSFYWRITFTNSSYIATSSVTNQTILNFGLDNCTTNTIMIFNYTLVDEQTQEKINETTLNSSIKIDLSLYPNSTMNVPLFQFSSFYNKTNPARVCISDALGSDSFYVISKVEYTANAYAKEFYNIYGYLLNASSNPSQNITLYDLLTASNQVFKITYRDSSYLPVSNALIQIGRLYVNEGVTKTVEIPITDSYGSTIANLEVNTVVYTFTITKNGVVLGTFPNSIAICQNPTLFSCEISLSSLSSNLPAVNFTSAKDFLYTLTYNNDTRTITTTFAIPSGAASKVTLNVSTETTSEKRICSTSATSSSGTLTCSVASSYGNSTVRAELYKGGVLSAWGNIDLEQTPQQLYGSNLVFLSIFIFLTLIGAGITDNPIMMTMSFLIGVFLLMMLNLTSATGGFIGGTATVLYLVIAIIIIIIKGVKRE